MLETLTFSQALAQFICEYPDAEIPETVFNDAVYRTLDTIGVALKALELDGAGIPLEFAKQSGGLPESTVVGSAIRTSAVTAALANGSLAHWPDFDDTDSDSMFHPSSVVVPTALALGEKLNATGRHYLSAMIVGAEVGLRVARCGRHQFQTRGYHATGVCGPFAAAAVAARLLELDRNATTSALGLAGCFCAGLLQGHSDGSWAKRFYSGWAAHTGILAALFAAGGAIGSAEIFEGGAGFYRVLLGDLVGSITMEDLVSDLGTSWSLPNVTFKPYPSAAWTHSSIDAILAIMDSERLIGADVEMIECDVPTAAIPLVCEPRDAKVRPKTVYHMKFSLPFTVAIAAVFGHVDLADFNETTLKDARLLDLAQRVTCVPEPSLSARGFPARVRLMTRSGKIYSREVLAQRGGPGNPIPHEDVLRKFTRNTENVLDAARSRELAEAILQLAETSDPRSIMALTHRMPETKDGKSLSQS